MARPGRTSSGAAKVTSSTAPMRWSGASRRAVSANASIPITPGSTGVPSIRWSSRNGCIGRVERGLDHDTVVHAHRGGADHRPGRGVVAEQHRRVDAAAIVVLGGHHPEDAGDDHLAVARARRQLASDPGDAGLGRQHLHAGHLHDLRDRTAGRHADAAPRRPVEREPTGGGPGPTEAAHDLAEQVVRRRVVGLSLVAEPSGHRREHDRSADRQVVRGVEQVEPAVALHVEDEVVLARLLVGQVAADLQPGGVEEHVDPTADVARRRSSPR